MRALQGVLCQLGLGKAQNRLRKTSLLLGEFKMHQISPVQPATNLAKQANCLQVAADRRLAWQLTRVYAVMTFPHT